jgi:hypothetical protein
MFNGLNRQCGRFPLGLRWSFRDQIFCNDCDRIESNSPEGDEHVRSQWMLAVAKLTSYQKAESYSAYLESQIEYAKQRLKVDEKPNLSTMLNNDLKLLSNTFGYPMPKVLGLLEDVVRLHAIKHGIQTKIYYSYVRMTFESLHLPAGLNALEEIGIPIRTLHRISALLDFPDGAGVDELAEHLRNN